MDPASVGRDRLFLAGLVGLAAALGFLLWPSDIVCHGLEDSAARARIAELSQAAALYELRHGTYPAGIPSPADTDRIVHYRCPGVHNPRSFDLWCEDTKGRADGINNWE